MASTTTALITVEEFERMPEPENPGKQELLNGELTQLPPAKEDHGNIVEALFLLLRTALGPQVHMERGYQMPPHNWLVPDVSVPWPDQPTVNGYRQGAPMIAVEVVSPGNSAEELRSKRKAYLTSGAAEVWIIYPATREMEVHTKGHVEEITDRYVCKIVPVEITLSELWQ